MKISNRILALIFVIFIACAAVIHCVVPEKEYSESEKRELSKLPDLSIKRFLDGNFTKDFDSYVSDQFFARDKWVHCKGMSQFLSGKRLLNDVFITNDRYIGNFKIEKQERLHKNLKAIQTLALKSDVPIYLLMVPETVGIYKELLPPFAIPDDQNALAEMIYRKLKDDVTIVWPQETLYNHRNEYIYYRTDHHWTPRGALYGYNELRRAMGRPEVPMPKFEAVNDQFHGSMLFKAGLGLPWIQPDQLQRPDTYINENFAVTVDDGKGEKDGLMFEKVYLKGEDKYRYYQGGNHPLMAIASNTGTGRVLVIKDSFCNVMMPYLASNYKTVYVTDMRFNRMSMVQYAKDMQIDEIILVYSVSSLCNESSISLLGN